MVEALLIILIFDALYFIGITQRVTFASKKEPFLKVILAKEVEYLYLKKKTDTAFYCCVRHNAKKFLDERKT